MRLGGPILQPYKNAEQWAEIVRNKGYRAVFCPIDCTASKEEVAAYRAAAGEADAVIAEVGVWNNVLHPNRNRRAKAVEFAKAQLRLAEEIGACCCVNVSGTLHPDIWYAPHPRNFDRDIFDAAVCVIREIIDEVQPRNTFYTLEPSPWLFPDTVESYLDMLKAVDREAFAVHWDPVNMICTPQRYYQNGAFLRECIEAFGNRIKSVHLKDVYMDEQFTLHIQERLAGDGILDYPTLIRELDRLNPHMPALVEHMHREEEADRAVAYVREVMAAIGEGSS